MSKYLQIEFKTGHLFQYSKEEKEEYEEHVSKNNNISYRKYYKKGIFGIYMGTYIKEDGNFGKEVTIHLRDKDNEDIYINMLLFDANKNITPYAESYITVLPDMQRGYAYRVFPFVMEREGTEYKNYGISVKHAFLNDESINESYPLKKLSYSYDKKGDDGKYTEVKGDIPKVEWEEDIDGDWKMNTSKKRKYLYDVLIENVTEFAGSSGEGGAKKVVDGPAPQPVINLNPEAPVESVPEPEQKTNDSKNTAGKGKKNIPPVQQQQEINEDDLPF